MLFIRARLVNCVAICASLAANLPVVGQTDLPSTKVEIGPAVVQQQHPSQVVDPNMGSIQVYNVPIEMVGVVGARLRVLYGNDPRVNITTEPGSGRLMVLAPPTVHQDIAARVELLQKDIRGNAPAKHNGQVQPASLQRDYKLKHVTSRDLEESLQRLSGPRMTVTTSKNGEIAQFRLMNATGAQDILQVDRKTNTVTLQGPSSNVYSWMQVVGALDQSRGAGEEAPKIVSLAPADPKRVERALNMVRTVALQQKAEEDQSIGSAKVGRGNASGDNERASAIGSIDSLDTESGLFGDVQIEFVGELGLVIVRGGKRDVQRVLEVIEQIKKQSEGTQPEVEVVLLKHINSQALETIATELYEEVLQPRQGPISIKALVQPNALLLVGRRESIASVIELVKKLDQPLDDSSQLKVYKLQHTSSTDAESLINDFFVEAPGSTNPVPGLGARVRVISDYRTNALVIQASPRDHLEVKRLLEEIDIETTTAQSEIRVFPLKYALSTELQPILQSAITGQAVEAQGGQGGGQQRTGGGGGANTGDGRVTPPSSNLSIVSKDKARTDSGILAGVIVTSNPSINSLLVRAPGKSMALIAALIDELDRPPSAESQLKVFEIKNGDATALALLVQQLFGLPTTAGASTTGGLFGGGGFGGNQQNQAGANAGATTGIVPLRVSVDTRTNSIIAAGSAVDLEVLEVLLARLDERGIETRTTEVIWLRNSNANNVATAISNLLQQQRTNIQQLLLTGQAISIFEQIDREVLVVAEPTTNSLIVSATPRYFQRIRDVIERLDRRPPMIMVQILLAEVLLEDNFELGTELGLQDALLFDRNSATGGTLTTPGFNVAGAAGSTLLTQPTNANRGIPQNVAGQGLSNFGLGRTNTTLGYGGLVLSAASESVNILFRALQDANRLQILSRPQVMTLDTVAAFVQVGSQVPRITSVSGGSTVAPPVISTQDVPVGLIMRVQPRTNQDGLILMDVQIERSKLGPESSGIPVGFSATGDVIRSPVIDTTRAETRVSAYDGQTVVFAGLISKNRTSRSRRIPFLADIPIAGNLFKFESETESRSELLVVMTPRIINDAEDVEMINQMESARMSWCMADVMNLHGVAGLSDGNGLWGPACSPVIYPDLQPSVEVINDQYGTPINGGSTVVDPNTGEPTPAPMIYSTPSSPVPVPGNPTTLVAPAPPIEVSSFSSQRYGNSQVAPAAAQSDARSNATPGTYIAR